ncbi:G-protein coupled receptor 83-like [Littorina saxatilis]|uniref:G-protein coupled receptor 83-like n=1 Tax=Littorina saxatilis TaxID=31220 RepID=UPI0038B4CA57
MDGKESGTTMDAVDKLLSNGLGPKDDLLAEVVNILNNSGSFNFSRLGTVDKTPENAILIFAYSILSIIAIFGNSLVVYVILKNRRLHTATNFFLANLAVSDLLVTCLNVPFNIMRHVMYDWVFGETLCHLVNFSLMVSVYVSTYTLTSIALDRHRMVLKPLSQRMSKTLAVGLLVSIWVLAILLSLPFGIYTTVEDFSMLLSQEGVLNVTSVRRCRTNYPSPSSRFEQYLTVTTIVLQYCVPLSLIGVAYGRIVQSLWSRTHVGAVTANQQMSQARAKRKSIKLLIAVVVVFALCWLPLNLYHLLTDLHPNPEVYQYNSKVFFACHWIAISSTCYNPFVYCWLNENFREEVKSRFRWCFRCWLRIKPCKSKEKLAKDAKRRRPDTSLGRSSMTSSARATSVRREVTLISDPDELLHSCLKPSDIYLTEDSPEREEEQDLLALHRNGRVEFHVARLHNCVNN